MQGEDDIEDIFEGQGIDFEFMKLAVEIRKNPKASSNYVGGGSTQRDGLREMRSVANFPSTERR
jgi:hypothetical protein